MDRREDGTNLDGNNFSSQHGLVDLRDATARHWFCIEPVKHLALEEPRKKCAVKLMASVRKIYDTSTRGSEGVKRRCFLKVARPINGATYRLVQAYRLKISPNTNVECNTYSNATIWYHTGRHKQRKSVI